MHPFKISAPEALGRSGKVFFTTNNKDDSSLAFDVKTSTNIRLYVPREIGVRVVNAVFESDFSKEKFIFNLYWTKQEKSYDIYETPIKLNMLGTGLYFFYFELESLIGKIYAEKSKTSVIFSQIKGSHPRFQLTVYDFGTNTEESAAGGVIYHVFVDRFRKAEPIRVRENCVFVSDWEAPLPEYPKYPGAPIKNNYFYGGNLYGVIEKLDYFYSLGVNLIYLSPIFDSVSNHKYDTSDYMKVDEAFGSSEALESLIEKAREYGIEIILDGVFNHTGADSVYFNKFSHCDSLGAYQSQNSPFYSWYEFQSFPNKYTSWWGIEILPRINPDNYSCRNFFTGDNGVIDKYAKMGIKGFRLDVADELSDDFIKSIKSRLKLHNTSALLYGEVWEDASNKIAYGKRKKYYLGSELDAVMNYPLRNGIISYLKSKKTDELSYALTDIINHAPKRVRNLQMNIIGTHDTERILTVLGAEDSFGKDNSYLYSKRMSKDEYHLAKTRLIAAYTILATLPGIPAIYYGDEAGVEGYSDPFNRTTYPWGKEDRDILNHYKKIGRIRRENHIYKAANFILHTLTSDVLIFSRYDNKESFITVFNNSNCNLNIHFNNRAKSLLSDTSFSSTVIPPLGTDIIKIKRNSTLTYEKTK